MAKMTKEEKLARRENRKRERKERDAAVKLAIEKDPVGYGKECIRHENAIKETFIAGMFGLATAGAMIFQGLCMTQSNVKKID